MFYYEEDISKHASKTDIPKISLVWNSIPSQLAKENKKFIYGAIQSNMLRSNFTVQKIQFQKIFTTTQMKIQQWKLIL